MKAPARKKTKAEHETEAREFVKKLSAVVGGDANRGNRAQLRRYWSDATRHDAWPILGRLGVIDHLPRTIVAALFAVHPEHREGIGVGTAAYRLGSDSPGSEGHPYDAHFRRLLACDDLESDLQHQLYRLVRRLERESSRPVPLDYCLLLRDLMFWQAGYAEGCRKEWARQFWQAPSEVTGEESQTETEA